jgi:hypothetical protein
VLDGTINHFEFTRDDNELYTLMGDLVSTRDDIVRMSDSMPYRQWGRVEVRPLRGRLRFDTPGHDYSKQPKGNRPPFGVCLVIWRRPPYYRESWHV